MVVVVAVAIDDPEWDKFKKTYKKTYSSDVDEEARYRLFLESKERVAKLNALNGQPAFGINWMSDRYESEKYKKGLKKPEGWVPTAPVREATLARKPKSIDWRLTDAVTAVKNQGQCGSCWAFSATEAVESQLTMSTGGKYRVDLSPQQITSCAPANGTYGCQGCNGGFTEGAYEYLKTVPGLSNSFFIPYEQSLTQSDATKACPTSKVNSLNGPMEQLQGSYAAVEGYKYATAPCTQGACEHQNLQEFAQALEETPVSICVNAGTWNDYTGGVLTSAACGPMGAMYQDHCVMAVGFNTLAPTPYWIVRNSWASTWGEQGYIYLEMAKNTCGLADDATIPQVKVDFMTDAEKAKVATLKEGMYQRATAGSEAAATMVI
jgi:C1A family cysteine protease